MNKEHLKNQINGFIVKPLTIAMVLLFVTLLATPILFIWLDPYLTLKISSTAFLGLLIVKFLLYLTNEGTKKLIEEELSNEN